ncbi:flagellar hook-basal body protein [Paenibacillus sp. NPDC058071]|uniref:flagellar hook-basal body protein n=1 Tax=Paenibacillus sp. NPDC058071 TaxID=3346326 RepID=UPI0036DDC03E
MNSSLINAMVSMNGYQMKLDMLADNMANVNTVGYKRKESTFEELLATMSKQPDKFQKDGRLTQLGLTQGWGSRMSLVVPNLEQGSIKETGLDGDLAIEGNAMFEVMTDDAGTRGYTRNGSFLLTVKGNGDTILATAEGYPVIATRGPGNDGPIVMPKDHKLRVKEDGTVQGIAPDGSIVNLGILKMSRVLRQESLTQVADNLYAVAGGITLTDVLQEIVPSSDNGVAIRQGALEQSNVNLTDEVTELITVQRAYQLASRALTSSDMMMGLANSLRK